MVPFQTSAKDAMPALSPDSSCARGMATSSTLPAAVTVARAPGSCLSLLREEGGYNMSFSHDTRDFCFVARARILLGSELKQTCSSIWAGTGRPQRAARRVGQLGSFKKLLHLANPCRLGRQACGVLGAPGRCEGGIAAEQRQGLCRREPLLHQGLKQALEQRCHALRHLAS